MSDDDEQLKTQLTKLILIHIRSLPLDLNDKECVENNCDRKLIDQLCKIFLKEKEVLLVQNQLYHHYHYHKDEDDATEANTNMAQVVTNFFWLLHSYADEINDCPYLLEEIVDFLHQNEQNNQDKRKPERNYSFLSRLLTTSVKCFQFYPAATQHTLGKVFEICKKQNNPELDEKVVFYSKLLQCDSFYTKDRVIR